MIEILGKRLGDCHVQRKKAQPLGMLGFLPAGLAEVSQGKKQSVVRSVKRESMGGVQGVRDDPIWEPRFSGYFEQTLTFEKEVYESGGAPCQACQ